jgi:hypothetical protein
VCFAAAVEALGAVKAAEVLDEAEKLPADQELLFYRQAPQQLPEPVPPGKTNKNCAYHEVYW